MSRSFREDNREVERANRLMFNVSYGVELGGEKEREEDW